MSESGSDKRSRVAMMINDSGLTWDLSRADVAALKHMWQLVVALATDVASRRGVSMREAIEDTEARIERGEQ